MEKCRDEFVNIGFIEEGKHQEDVGLGQNISARLEIGPEKLRVEKNIVIYQIVNSQIVT